MGEATATKHGDSKHFQCRAVAVQAHLDAKGQGQVLLAVAGCQPHHHRIGRVERKLADHLRGHRAARRPRNR